MLRLNLLRHLAAADSPDRLESAPPAAGGPLKPVMGVLLLLLIAGSAAVWLSKPDWMNFEGPGRSTAQADSLRRVEAHHTEASRLVVRRQDLAIEWLYRLEAALPSVNGSEPLVRSTFTLPDQFLLQGSVATAEALNALQEALVLIPGLDLRQSRAVESEPGSSPGFLFQFAGIVTLEAEIDTVTANDSVGASESSQSSERMEENPDAHKTADASPTGVPNRVAVNQEAVTAHLDTLLAAARTLGITFSSPQAGPVTRSGILKAHPFRLVGTWGAADSLDSLSTADSLAPFKPLGVTAVRTLLEKERQRNSPFAIQRVVLENRAAEKTVFLDILALTP